MSSLFTSELKEGMVTLTDTYSTKGKLVLVKNSVLTKSIINRLINNDVIFVEVSDESVYPDSQSIIEENIEQQQNTILNSQEYKIFKQRYTKNIQEVSEQLNDIVHKNAPIEVDTLLNNTMDIINSTSSPLSIFSMMSNMKSYDDSTFNHSLNVSLICNIFAKWLDLSDSEIELVTACGLLHDIGKILIPDHIIKKPGKLTDDEYKIVKKHPKKGYDLLKQKNTDIQIQHAALMHHEKCDGSGYPLGLIDNQIDWVAQIVTIADIYEAMTANRVYRKALSPFTVINQFEENGLRKYNPKYLLTFLERVVNSYVNCKVKLSNGEEGDIVYINRVNLSKPLVKTKDNYIDLAKQYHVSIESIM